MYGGKVKSFMGTNNTRNLGISKCGDFQGANPGNGGVIVGWSAWVTVKSEDAGSRRTEALPARQEPETSEKQC